MSERIAIVGMGHMGTGLAKSFARAGHIVYLGSREEGKAEAVARTIRADQPEAVLFSGGYADAPQNSDIVVVAVPFREAAGVLTALGETLAGKVVVDITNPFGAVPPDVSGAETHARLLPSSASLVAAWKTTSWKLLDSRTHAGVRHDVFLCADDEAAKARIAALVTQTGFRPVDCGALANARVLDAMVPLMIEIDRRYGGDHLMAWKFLP